MYYSLPVPKESRRSLFVLIGLLLDSKPKLFACGCIDKLPKSDKSPRRSQLLLDATGCETAGTTEDALSNELSPSEDKFPDSDIPPNRLGTVDDMFGGGITFGKTVGKPPIIWEFFLVSEKAVVKSANPSFDLSVCGWLPNAVSKSPNSPTFFVSLLSPALGSNSSFNKLLARRNKRELLWLLIKY